MEYALLLSPIMVVLLIAFYFIWRLRRSARNKIKQQIIASGDRGEFKVRKVLRSLENRNSRYKVYHNVRLGPDESATNEYDTVIVGPNGIFHIETKNYGGERGGIIDIDSKGNWILHKKNGYSKIITNPAGQVGSHEYRLKGFLMKVVGIRNLPTQGIIVLSCDNIRVRDNEKTTRQIPILNRHELADYIRNYKKGKMILYPRTVRKICKKIEAMNDMARADQMPV